MATSRYYLSPSSNSPKEEYRDLFDHRRAHCWLACRASDEGRRLRSADGHRTRTARGHHRRLGVWIAGPLAWGRAHRLHYCLLHRRRDPRRAHQDVETSVNYVDCTDSRSRTTKSTKVTKKSNHLGVLLWPLWFQHSTLQRTQRAREDGNGRQCW